MTRDEPRAKCIMAQAVAVVRIRGLHWDDLHPVTQQIIIDEQTAAFDALNGLAVVAAIDSAFNMTSYFGNEYEVVSILSDLTNAPEKKP